MIIPKDIRDAAEVVAANSGDDWCSSLADAVAEARMEERKRCANIVRTQNLLLPASPPHHALLAAWRDEVAKAIDAI